MPRERNDSGTYFSDDIVRRPRPQTVEKVRTTTTWKDAAIKMPGTKIAAPVDLDALGTDGTDRLWGGAGPLTRGPLNQRDEENNKKSEESERRTTRKPGVPM